jgi:hypothetical protein
MPGASPVTFAGAGLMLAWLAYQPDGAKSKDAAVGGSR